MKTKKGRVEGSAQKAEVQALLEGMVLCEQLKIRSYKVILDSYYCYQALTDDLYRCIDV
ncbi:MAG: reverse transcriptase-like protein [Cetobacterium sp.]